MKRKKEPIISSTANPSPRLTLRLIISNGDPRQDARLELHFQAKAPGQAQLWVVSLPQLANVDAFARQVAPGGWELKLDAVAQTRPIKVANYTSENAMNLLDGFLNPEGESHAELLILARNGIFTINVTVSN